jgi:transposase
MMPITTIGLDIAKHVFQVHGVDDRGHPVSQRRLRRSDVRTYFAQIEPCLIGIEACHSSHYWARTLTALGHEVRLIPPQYVRPYVRGGKNDARDAEAICDAVSRPAMRVVSVKSAEQLALQALHRMRARLIHDRTATANQMRSFLSEEGFVFPQGLAGFRTRLIALLDAPPPDGVTPMLRELARRFLEQVRALDEWIDGLNAQLRHAFSANETCQRLAEVVGIGPVIATAVVGTVGNARAFKNGRQFAAWMGLTPRQHSSGERTRLLGITKRGDAYLRTLFVQGARAVLRTVARRRDRLGQWLQQLLTRRHKHVVAIALANKMARITWAVLAKGAVFHLDLMSTPA